MEGFLSLEQAAEQLQFSISELSRQIEEGRVVAIVRDGSPWLSAGEVSRLRRQSERSAQPAPPPTEELRLLRLSKPEVKLEMNRPEVKLEAVPVKPEVKLEITNSEPEAPAPEAPRPEAPRPEAPRPEAPKPEPPRPEPAKPDPVKPEPVKPELAKPVAVKPGPAPAAVAELGTPEPDKVSAEPPVGDDKMAMQIRDLNKRCAELEARNQELEATSKRLKSGLQETEATLKRNRIARANLENDVVGLQDQLGKARGRNEGLEREIQQLGSELERNEDAHNNELRRMRSNKAERQEERDQASSGHAGGGPTHELDGLRNQMSEKDRLLAQEYEQRAALRSQLEDKQQKYFELKARYDKEKSEWSELLAQALQNQGNLRQQIEELKAKNPKGWNPFRREK